MWEMHRCVQKDKVDLAHSAGNGVADDICRPNRLSIRGTV
ncbi:hypothetical protein D1BOALGB6SA_4194 [Olavius sp. associated proteobacterium Delta 1]|nr:hypothetical protein D1BOALGB6SA_4194 [Olavius sp. associated proteobacterium Delta 1]